MASASPPEFTVSLLTDDEKWYFDNFGYLVLRGAVPAADVTQMLSELDGWLHALAEPPAPLNRGRQGGASRRENVSHPQYASAAFSRLNLNAEILRVVSGMMMGCPRLMHMVATKMWRSPAAQSPPGLHRDTDGFNFPLGFRNPHNDYQTNGGELYASHVATWVALVDVPHGTGFALVPGTHKSSFEAPHNLLAVHAPPVSITVPLSKGDVIVFSTNLLHAASNWTVDEYPRANVFQRFCLSAYFGLGEKSTNFAGAGYPLDGFRHKISDAQYELESPSKQEKAVIREMRASYNNTAAAATATATISGPIDAKARL